MISFSRMALSSIRFVRRVWPFQFCKDFATYVGAFATKIGLLGSEWYEFQLGLWMRLNVRDLIQQTILLKGFGTRPSRPSLRVTGVRGTCS